MSKSTPKKRKPRPAVPTLDVVLVKLADGPDSAVREWARRLLSLPPTPTAK